MAQSGYQANPGFLAALGRSRAVGDAMVQAAERGAEWARANAPVRTGEYRNSFEVERVDVSVAGKDRAGALLINTATREQRGQDYPYAWAAEWGQGGKHILQRAVDVIEKG